MKKMFLAMCVCTMVSMGSVSSYADEGLSTDADNDGVTLSTAASATGGSVDDGLDTDSDGVRNTGVEGEELDVAADDEEGFDAFFDVSTRPSEGLEPDEIDAQNNAATPGVEPDEIDYDGGGEPTGDVFFEVSAPPSPGLEPDEIDAANTATDHGEQQARRAADEATREAAEDAARDTARDAAGGR